MRARLLPVWIVVAAGLFEAGPALASFHEIKVVEVFPGTAAAPQAQYVVLQMYAGGQNLVGGHSLTVYGPDGGLLATASFTGNVANGADQAKILVATIQAATFFNFVADLTMGPVLPLGGGKICWDVYDCVAWGTYAKPGGDLTVGTPFNSPAAPLAGTAAFGLVSGRALVRRLNLAGSPTILDPGDDTNVSSNDFVLGPPAPRNDANQNGTIPASTCGDGMLGGLEGCDDNGTVAGDGCSATCAVEFCGDLVQSGAETCDDGNRVSGDGCDENCTPTGCGNGVVTAGESCDPPNGGNCSPTCQSICVGDPDCADTDPCTTAERCVATACVVDPTPIDDGEPCTVDSCDAGGLHHLALGNGSSCVLASMPATRALCVTGVCEVARCGDGYADPNAQGGPEACDDGNTVDDDGCTNACTLPRCGDGIVQAGEACDGGAGCTAACRRESGSGGGCGSGDGAPGLALAALLLAGMALRRRGPRPEAGTAPRR